MSKPSSKAKAASEIYAGDLLPQRVHSQNVPAEPAREPIIVTAAAVVPVKDSDGRTAYQVVKYTIQGDRVLAAEPLKEPDLREISLHQALGVLAGIR